MDFFKIPSEVARKADDENIAWRWWKGHAADNSNRIGVVEEPPKRKPD